VSDWVCPSSPKINYEFIDPNYHYNCKECGHEGFDDGDNWLSINPEKLRFCSGCSARVDIDFDKNAERVNELIARINWIKEQKRRSDLIRVAAFKKNRRLGKLIHLLSKIIEKKNQEK